jgi:3-deoxy-7-phosphoheptulonate synthase
MSIMVDASHGNSQKKFKEQINVIKNIGDQIASGNEYLKGVMIESHIYEGNQSISDNMKYGQSITDACINLDDTSACLDILSESVSKRRLQ